MGLIVDRLATLSIDVMSSDETVRATLTKSSGIKLEFDGPLEELHTEQSLETQIEEVLNAALDGYDQAASMIRTEAYGAEVASQPPTERQKRFEDAGKDIHLRAVSHHRYIELEWIGKSDFVITIHKDTLRKLNDVDFQNEINNLIDAATIAYTKMVSALHKRIYMSLERNRNDASS